MKVSAGSHLAVDQIFHISLAANNGEIGGGEVMLLAMADSMSRLGVAVSIIGPRYPSGLIDEARTRGFKTVALPAASRTDYMRALRKWDRHNREGILWCNGLLPAVATAGHAKRVVHLHQRPRGKQRVLARIARWSSIITLVPSADMAAAVRGAFVLHNWVEGLGEAQKSGNRFDSQGPTRLGFLGRPSTDKGVEVLAEAMQILDRESPDQYRLVLAGESRFVDQASRTTVEAALASLGNLVERTGWIEPKDFFARVDVLVCPSVWAESFGLVVAESMSARVPVVVSDAGALPEVVGPEHPWIAISGDAEDLARVVRQAAQGDSAVVERAFQRWQSLFSPEAGRQRLGVLLDDLGFSTTPQGKS